jgi:hypothetical protein
MSNAGIPQPMNAGGKIFFPQSLKICYDWRQEAVSVSLLFIALQSGGLTADRHRGGYLLFEKNSQSERKQRPNQPGGERRWSDPFWNG